MPSTTSSSAPFCTLPQPLRDAVEPFLPQPACIDRERPFLTLTYASTLDGQLARRPHRPTAISNKTTKSMTALLRLYHDAILVGHTTATADDPKLTSKHAVTVDGALAPAPPAAQPRPLILDPNAAWEPAGTELCREGYAGKAPWVLVRARTPVPDGARATVERVGGAYVGIEPDSADGRLRWSAILGRLAGLGIRSVMVEGGARVIEGLIADERRVPGLVSSFILTLAPAWSGRAGAGVSIDVDEGDSNEREVAKGADLPAVRVKEPVWIPMNGDVVLCGHGIEWEE